MSHHDMGPQGTVLNRPLLYNPSGDTGIRRGGSPPFKMMFLNLSTYKTLYVPGLFFLSEDCLITR